MMRRSAGLALLAALGMPLAACDSSPTGPLRPDAGGPPGDGGRVEPVTYYGDVRPILVENCVMCHVEGGIGPFALTSYEGAVAEAEEIAQVTRDRIMPPFLADNSGACNTWSNHRGLTDEEIATIGAWVEMGTLEGDPTTPAPEPAELPRLPSVDATLEMQAEYTTSDTFDDEYRCFVLDPGLTANQYLIGYDVHPGNVQRVHHVIVYAPVSDEAAADAIALDEAQGDATDGYQCFGAAGVPAVPVVLWAPGTGATSFPRGTGLELAAGRPLIMQVHYNNQVPASVPRTDRTQVDLALAASATPALMTRIADLTLNLPPREPEVVESETIALGGVLPFNVRVFGVLPHMHTLGRTISLEILRGGATPECLIDVPRWDFHWQMAYWLTRPITVTPEDSARITCTFDTRTRTETTRFGERTEDEMCLAFVYVSL